jgi:hypothetical protein
MVVFTWNLHRSEAALRLALEHLEPLARSEHVLASFQEIPPLARGRGAWRLPGVLAPDELGRLGLRLVGAPVGPGRVILLISSSLDTEGEARQDGNGRMLYVRLRIGSVRFAAAGVHAVDRLNHPTEFERGSHAALARRELDERWDPGRPLVMLGDFNADPGEREICAREGLFAVRRIEDVTDAARRHYGRPSPGEHRGISAEAIMSEFGERLRSRLERMAASGDEEVAPSPYDDVLLEFVRELNQANLLLHAELKVAGVPHRRLIEVWPKYRRFPRLRLLAFSIDGARIHLLAEDMRELPSVDALKQFLEGFVVSNFPSTVDVFREIASEPVQGYLRTRGAFEIAPEDVLVIVSPEEQQQLATAAPGTSLTLDVVPQRFPGAGIYDPARAYTALESGGFALERTRVVPVEAGRVRVTGVVTALADEAEAA